LSAREREVLQLLAQGLATKQIARSLGVTERTVKFHVASIFAKLGATNRAQAVALAAQHNLL
jgi:DNA-binding CsgD family transcriptional regulator